LGYWRSGREAYLKLAPNIEPAVHDPSSYGLVVLGTPIWAGNMSFESLAEDYADRVTVAKVDIDERPKLAARYARRRWPRERHCGASVRRRCSATHRKQLLYLAALAG
jgi:hypothetical protein